VAANGWSEGECKGKAGWFPSAYVEQRDKAPASKVIEPGLLTTWSISYLWYLTCCHGPFSTLLYMTCPMS